MFLVRLRHSFFLFLAQIQLVPFQGEFCLFLKRGDLTFLREGVVLSIQASKTIQFQDRVVQVPLARVPNSPLCPAQAALLMCKLTVGAPQDPLFRFQKGKCCQALSYSTFLALLKQKLGSLGFDPSQYAGHSFRRGGTTLALSCNVPAELVKLHGDWASAAYLRYFDPTLGAKFTLAQVLANQVPK